MAVATANLLFAHTYTQDPRAHRNFINKIYKMCVCVCCDFRRKIQDAPYRISGERTPRKYLISIVEKSSRRVGFKNLIGERLNSRRGKAICVMTPAAAAASVAVPVVVGSLGSGRLRRSPFLRSYTTAPQPAGRPRRAVHIYSPLSRLFRTTYRQQTREYIKFAKSVDPQFHASPLR